MKVKYCKWCRVFIFNFIIIIPLLASCKETLIKNDLPIKNPCEYVFSGSRDSIWNIISTKLKCKNMQLWRADQYNMVINSVSQQLHLPGNQFDFCLESMMNFGKSKIYLKENGDSLDFSGWFYIHLETITLNRTKISISVFEPTIYVNQELLPKPPHFVRKYSTVSVEPSTIEEYEILLKIGSLLSQTNMPPLILPNPKKFNIVKMKSN